MKFLIIFVIAVMTFSHLYKAKEIISGSKEKSIVVRINDFKSKYIQSRNIDIYLPASYEKKLDKNYPVVYMHDGQNLFDPSTSYIGVDWGIDETMDSLTLKDEIKEAIVVGIWNSVKRFNEYMPQKPYEEFLQYTPEQNPQPQIISDDYLKFLVEEVKSYIDANYRTLSDKSNTFVMGSSMGGLISLYAICEYPETFGGAGCISTHWPAGKGIVIEYMKKYLPDPADHKIYFDYGTETLDSLYEPYQTKVDKLMKEKGFEKNSNWITKKFQGHEHSERAWRKRVHLPIKFLLN